jgi:hypothetical protein
MGRAVQAGVSVSGRGSTTLAGQAPEKRPGFRGQNPQLTTGTIYFHQL